jgi:hypothetical protein
MSQTSSPSYIRSELSITNQSIRRLARTFEERTGRFRAHWALWQRFTGDSGSVRMGSRLHSDLQQLVTSTDRLLEEKNGLIESLRSVEPHSDLVHDLEAARHRISSRSSPSGAGRHQSLRNLPTDIIGRIQTLHQDLIVLEQPFESLPVERQQDLLDCIVAVEQCDLSAHQTWYGKWLALVNERLVEMQAESLTTAELSTQDIHVTGAGDEPTA